MHFSKLRLLGFKSFVDQTDFVIEPGLTGIVGPNGCGKSNLVEALRWVMGENSSRNMRASGMDDVIFSGSGARSARNIAEVGLVLDNSDRRAPAAFNDADVLEVTRRIERESGSAYRVNGRETRARDVQLLFADAATGARSTAMVRQGQIGEIIAAKPQARRRILEEAAGIAGLGARRHEAELRLRAAEENLLRLDDVLKQIEVQADGLKRQARQSGKYKQLAAAIRQAEALHALIEHTDAQTGLADARRTDEADLRTVGEATRAQAETARLAGVAAHALPALRDAETEAAAALQKLIVAREALDGEERRVKGRMAELERRIAQMESDGTRQNTFVVDADETLARLNEEKAALAATQADDAAARARAARDVADAQATLTVSERALAAAQTASAEADARRGAAERRLREENQRLARLEADRAKLDADAHALRTRMPHDDTSAPLLATLEAATEALRGGETQAATAETALATVRERESAMRGPLAEAERMAQRAETEVATLRKLLDGGGGGFWPPVTDAMSVQKGYEAALGAALGDDLDASDNPSAPARWITTDALNDPPLPPGVTTLATLVSAPPALRRRLAQIGVVLRAEGDGLRKRLAVGQRLVSREGDLWRWDGFTQAAEAPTPAARRLAERNRLGDLTKAAEAARTAADALRADAELVQADLRRATQTDAEARTAVKTALRARDLAKDDAARAEREQAQAAARLDTLNDAQARLKVTIDEAQAAQARAGADLAALTPQPDLQAALDAARNVAVRDRTTVAETQTALQSLTREADGRARRRDAVEADIASWIGRAARARAQIVEFETRLTEAKAEQRTLADAPDTFFTARRSLVAQIGDGETAKRIATEARAKAEAETRSAEAAAREALDAMASAREAKARSEARLEAAAQRLEATVHHIATELDCRPDDLAPIAGVVQDAPMPPLADVEERLDGLKSDRDRLGAVNLRADEELAEAEKTRGSLVAEKDDLSEAIRRLRQAITSLNKEGRERLVGAFDTVNDHFKSLFTVLFDGGTAELQLIEAEDPLQAGLEILARPPGKKPQVMTLLSGGEQALTAMSLVFAVFLTNPSPICVLDEVDAPLDDANVERFCDLLDDMRRRTDTRFVTITHNPVTMARMDRLFGVTMAERGVSQLVSVDLVEAERFLEAS